MRGAELILPHKLNYLQDKLPKQTKQKEQHKMQ